MGHMWALSVLEGVHKQPAHWKDETKYVRIKYFTETEIMAVQEWTGGAFNPTKINPCSIIYALKLTLTNAA